ncbi:MAG: flagellar hook-length control protein FliK, partial [Phycisphaerae bacterium]
GAEQTGQGRGTGDLADPSSGSRLKQRTGEDRRVSQQGTSKQSSSLSRPEFDRLVRTIRMKLGQRQSTARLHLRPPELGRIRIDTRMVGDRLEVLVQAQAAGARELLHSRMADLQSALEQQGVRLERFELTALAPEPGNEQSSGPATGGQDDPRQSGTAGDSGLSDGQQGTGSAFRSDMQSAQTEERAELVAFAAAAETRLDLQA